MDVSIKEFYVDMAVKNKGIEFGVNEPNGAHKGDMILTKTGLEWCAGKTKPGNGVKVSWTVFIEWMNSRNKS